VVDHKAQQQQNHNKTPTQSAQRVQMAQWKFNTYWEAGRMAVQKAMRSLLGGEFR
jgi:hypothetical protein